MGFVVMNPNKPDVQREGQRLPGFEARHQRVRQAGPLRGRHSLQHLWFNIRLREGSLDNRRQVAQVFARRQLRHDTTVLRMQLGLRGNDIGKNDPLRNHRRACLIARSFKRQKHRAKMPIFPAARQRIRIAADAALTCSRPSQPWSCASDRRAVVSCRAKCL